MRISDLWEGLIDRKIRKGTSNYLYEAAMTPEEFDRAIEIGVEIVDMVHAEGSSVVSFGEMGIANTSSSSLWMTYLTGIPLSDCVGAGSGLSREGVEHKYNVLKRCMENYKGDGTPKDIIRYFGGFEMVAAVGGMLRAAELGMVIIVDGFIMTNCVLAGKMLYPALTDYCIYGHQGDECGHKLVLDCLTRPAFIKSRFAPRRRDGSYLRLPLTCFSREHDQRDGFFQGSGGHEIL